MKAMILSAGLGERLRPLTHEMPKPLIPVANRPIIEYNLNLLKIYGITDVIMNVHYMGDQIKEHLGDGRHLGLKITYSDEPVLLGSGGGIKKMGPFCRDETFLVMNADILVHIDLEAVMDFHASRKALATMVLRPNPDPVKYGTIETDQTGRIREFLGKVRTVRKGLDKWMFTGIHIMEPEALDLLPGREAFCINRDVYAQWIRSDWPCYGYIHQGYWKDLGTPDDYLQANLDLIEEKELINHFQIEVTETHQTPKEVPVTPPCLIGTRSSIHPSAEIGPRAVIGKGSTIGEGAAVSQSVLWPGSLIKNHEKIRCMIVTPYQRVQAGSHSDSILTGENYDH